MANHVWKPIGTARQGIRKVILRFFPQGTSNTPLTQANGFLRGVGVASVTRQGAAGVFLVVLEDAWQATQLIAAVPGVQHTTAADLVAQVGDFTSGTNSAPAQFVVRINAAAVPTDIAANANNSVSVELTFNNNPRT